MNIKLQSNLPEGKYTDKISGIYKITFDNGLFYIGSSSHIRRRLYEWKRALSGIATDKRNLWEHLKEKIEVCFSAVFELIEVVESAYLLDREEIIMVSYRHNPLMVNKILHPKNGVIVKKDGVEIIRYPSLKSAAKGMNIFVRRIQDVCNGRRKRCKGYSFEYENLLLKIKNDKYLKKEKPDRVFKYSVDGLLVKSYKTTKAAAKDSGISPKGVYSVIKGIQRTSGGFVFKST